MASLKERSYPRPSGDDILMNCALFHDEHHIANRDDFVERISLDSEKLPQNAGNISIITRRSQTESDPAKHQGAMTGSQLAQPEEDVGSNGRNGFPTQLVQDVPYCAAAANRFRRNRIIGTTNRCKHRPRLKDLGCRI